MSTTPVIKNLVRLSLLERVTPDLLARFLRPYEAYLVARGVELDAAERDHAWAGRLHDVLCAADPDMPGKLQQALLDVADLASEQGHEAALNLAGERQFSLFSKSGDVTMEDLAFRLYLEHSEVFTASHARVQSQEARRFVDFFPRGHRPLVGADSESKRVLLKEQLRRWFADRNRGEYVEVRVADVGDELSLVIIHGQTPRSVSVITSAFSRDRMNLVPDKQDTVVFDKVTGRLSVSAQFAAEHGFYRQSIGKVFFGDDNHFQPRDVLDCSVLVDDPRGALSPAGVPMLRHVALREVTFKAVDAPRDTIVWRAATLHDVFADEVVDFMRRGRFVSKAKLALSFVNEARAKTVEIAPPNKLTYDRRTYDAVVHEFLLARGFLRLPDARVAQAS